MKFKYISLVSSLVIFTMLSGCNWTDNRHIKCDDEKALNLLQTTLKDDLKKNLNGELKSLINENVIKDLDPNKLGLSANQIDYSLNDSRTNFIDPDSTKTKCAIDLTISIPLDLIKRSNDAREKVGQNSVSKEANNANLDFENNKIKLILEYETQPNDKGDKIFVLLHNAQPAQQFISNTLTYAFLKPQIEKNQVKAREETSTNVSTGYDSNAAAEATEAAAEAQAAASDAQDDY